MSFDAYQRPLLPAFALSHTILPTILLYLIKSQGSIQAGRSRTLDTRPTHWAWWVEDMAEIGEVFLGDWINSSVPTWSSFV
jgi:hypothetical protein